MASNGKRRSALGASQGRVPAINTVTMQGSDARGGSKGMPLIEDVTMQGSGKQSRGQSKLPSPQSVMMQGGKK
jgi:hypothetical protein